MPVFLETIASLRLDPSTFITEIVVYLRRFIWEIYKPNGKYAEQREVWIHQPSEDIRKCKSLFNGVKALYLCFVEGSGLLDY